MKIETSFDIGDKVFLLMSGIKVRLATIGQVRISITDSPGIEGEELFSNYMPQKEREERYMCIETGIGSGQVWEEGKGLFRTEELAKIASKEKPDV
jgi:hypothetical protein